MPKYRYTGTGTMTFYVDGEPYCVSKTIPNKDVVELEKKIEIAGLELIDEGEMTIKKKKKKGGE
jgi:hypothetical protein